MSHSRDTALYDAFVACYKGGRGNDEHAKAQIKTGASTHLHLDSRIKMPIRIREHSKLRRNTPILPEPLLPSVPMPLEQKVHKAVLLQRVVRRLFDSVQQPTEGRRIGGRPEGVRLSHASRGEEDVEDEQVGERSSSRLDFVRSWCAPGKSVG